MKVLLLGAGGAASNGFARALKAEGGYELVGTNANADDLLLSECDTNHLIAPASDRARWRNDLFEIVFRSHVDLIHAQPDLEVQPLGLHRVLFHTMGARTFLPRDHVIGLCRDKWLSYQRWQAANIPVPKTRLVHSEHMFFNWDGPMWLRPRVGQGGQGSYRVEDPGLAARLMRRENRWGVYTCAEVLPGRSVTVQQLYWRGELVVSQQRTRKSWANAASTTTGVSGSTGVGVTSSDQRADEVADAAVAAVDDRPHGLYGIDMTYDRHGMPCPTEINIGRFFTTMPEFMQQAGFNIAHLYCRLFPTSVTRAAFYPQRNPVPDGKQWVRGMDRPPVLVG